MQCEIMMIGTELLLGQIVDSNAAFMGKVLAENGIPLYQKTTVGDNQRRIVAALDAALSRCDVVLTSGGLGPTEDDITRECVAELLGRPLEFRQELLDQLVSRFAHFRVSITENNKKQAMAPRGAVAIENLNGTAPGLIVDDARGVVICMPGVPRELKPMLTDQVIPYLRERFGLRGLLHSRVLKVCGVGESRVDAAMGDLIVNQQNPTVGVLASPDAVRIRITAFADSVEAANALIDPVDAEVRKRLPGLVMGVNDATLEGTVDALLVERGWTLAVAECHTGGMIAQRLTAANAAAFVGGRVLARAANVDAREMADAARAETGATSGLAVGLAGDGGSSRIVFVTPDGTQEWTFGIAQTAELDQIRVTVAALERVRRYLAVVPEPVP
ncbi:MAG TPA: CinA family nicotinamide mononucleotide deamidase-related protein [Candidatus Hydrogenedentes bacterium]|nr:CinA family nicotinamide mononucleotide deamidase-related protein [Candidatus Hydrogenedentota bacterium]HPG68408.1 CinA family nicotinamide mononucleotide deamidase-related protein [Candidatus Hydrogenedentota bacterium]